MKTLKFRSELAKKVLSGEKDVTWRIFDEKELAPSDELDLIIKETGEVFAKARIISVYEKKLKDFEDKDYEGHEKFNSRFELEK